VLHVSALFTSLSAIGCCTFLAKMLLHPRFLSSS